MDYRLMTEDELDAACQRVVEDALNKRFVSALNREAKKKEHKK